MDVILRTDASLDIGTGHVMRCLTLAQALRERGARCRFVSRMHRGHMIDAVRAAGFDVLALPEPSADWAPHEDGGNHVAWLGADPATDADQTLALLNGYVADWLVVDHYGIDARWETGMRRVGRKLLVIDDLADRTHDCDMLLDQTFGRNMTDYVPLVPTNCLVLCGSRYALLRPEFAGLRRYSLQRRAKPVLGELLITMGGVDKGNATGVLLQALQRCPLPKECRITVVLGATAPWLAEVSNQALNMPWPTRVLFGVSDMAQLMSDSDLAIGAAGATSWERCCLGLPSLMLVLAENQRFSARRLELAGAVRMISLGNDLPEQLDKLIAELVSSEACLWQLCERTSTVTDGLGCSRIANLLTS